MTMLEQVQGVIGSETGESDVSLDTPIFSLVTDSLERANLIVELEAMSGKEIPDEDAQKFFTIRDVVEYLEKE